MSQAWHLISFHQIPSHRAFFLGRVVFALAAAGLVSTVGFDPPTSAPLPGAWCAAALEGGWAPLPP